MKMKTFSIKRGTFCIYVRAAVDATEMDIRHKAAAQLDAMPMLFFPSYTRPQARAAIYFGNIA